MKVKTNFKKMYLIDDDMYNTINSKMLDRDNIQNQHYENRFNPTIHLNQNPPLETHYTTHNIKSQTPSLNNHNPQFEGISHHPKNENELVNTSNSITFNADVEEKRKNTFSNQNVQENSINKTTNNENQPQEKIEEVKKKFLSSPLNQQISDLGNVDRQGIDDTSCIECDKKNEKDESSKLHNLPAKRVPMDVNETKHSMLSKNDSKQFRVEDRKYDTHQTSQFKPLENQTNQVSSIFPNTNSDSSQFLQYSEPHSLQYLNSVENYPMEVDTNIQSSNHPIMLMNRNVNPQIQQNNVLSKSSHKEYNQFNQPSTNFSGDNFNPPPSLEYSRKDITPSALEYRKPLKLKFDSSNQALIQPPIKDKSTKHMIKNEVLNHNTPSKNQNKEMGVVVRKIENLPSLKNRSSTDIEKRIERKSKDFSNGINQKVKYTCTICNTDFKKQSALLRHNKNFHEAFHQLNKGEKRKLPEVYFKPVKKVKHQKDMKRKSVYPIEFSPKKLKSLGYYESYEK